LSEGSVKALLGDFYDEEKEKRQKMTESNHQPTGSEEELLALFEGYSWIPLHNLGCFFLELGNVALAKKAFQLSNSNESLMALADLLYLENDFVSCELLWRKVDTKYHSF